MFGGVPQRPREIPIRQIVPNVLTSTALCCGLAALHFALKAQWDRAVLAVLFSAVFDALDGRAARLLHVSSRFGAVLDSLSDFLSFGVAPALILYVWKIGDRTQLGRWEVLGVAAVMLFALCSALRLARFTAQAPATPPAAKSNPLYANFFIGMPTPAAAAAVLIPVMLDNSKRLEARWDLDMPWQVVVVHTFVVAWLMISRTPMFSFKKVRISRAWLAPFLAAVALVVALAAWDFWLASACLSAAYLCSLPLSVMSYHRLARTELATESSAPAPRSDAAPATSAQAPADPSH